MFRGALIALFVCAVVPQSLLADDIDAFLKAGEFGPALKVAEGLPPAQRNAAMNRITAAQNAAGCFPSSSSAIVPQTAGAPPARGGGVVADFDTLMTLIQETIAPDTWEEAGGPGRISPFPLGVHVDAAGLLKRTAASKGESGSLLAARLAALRASNGREVRAESELRKVSLTRLERELDRRMAEGLGPNDAMQHLAGLRRIQYLFVYPETGDIVIAGPAGDWTTDAEGRAVAVERAADGESPAKETTTPVMHLDDLLVLLRQAQKPGPFTCTIEPTQEGLKAAQDYLAETGKKPLKEGKAAREKWVNGLRDALGKQNIKVGGIDARTRVARTIVEADYHMKRIGMGLEPGVPGVVSYLDTVEVKNGEPVPMDVVRFWFTLGDAPPSTTEQHNAFSFHKGSVLVLSENEFLKKTGEVVYTGKTSERGLKFAQSFTNKFDALAAKYPIYADLRNVFDLAIVAALIEHEGLADQVGWQMTAFLDRQRLPVEIGPAPAQVESICNSRVVNGNRVIAGVSGGVEVDATKVVGDKLKLDNYGALKAGHGSSSPKKLSHDGWWWD